MRGRIKITLEQLRIAAKVRCVCGGEGLSTLGCGFVVVTSPMLCGDGGGQSAWALVLLCAGGMWRKRRRPEAYEATKKMSWIGSMGKSYHATTFNETGHDVWSTAV